MKIRYTVHSVERQDVTADVVMGGKKVEAKVPGLIVEIVSDDGVMGHTLRFVPDDMDAALTLFTVGTEVDSTFTAAS